MITLYGLFLIIMSAFMLGGVLFVKLDELNKLVGTKETLVFLAVLFLMGAVFRYLEGLV